MLFKPEPLARRVLEVGLRTLPLKSLLRSKSLKTPLVRTPIGERRQRGLEILTIKQITLKRVSLRQIMHRHVLDPDPEAETLSRRPVRQYKDVYPGLLELVLLETDPLTAKGF